MSPKGGSMLDLGPDDGTGEALMTWFDEQEAKNLDRLEQTAQTFIQLVTGLFGVVFAVLALSDAPDYLQSPLVRQMGLLSLLMLGITLVASLIVVFPYPYAPEHEYSVTQRATLKTQMTDRKVTALRVALGTFLIGILAFGILIATILLA